MPGHVETAPTPEHPDGQVLSNWFLRRIEDRFTGEFQIVGGKTGYVVQAGLLRRPAAVRLRTEACTSVSPVMPPAPGKPFTTTPPFIKPTVNSRKTNKKSGTVHRPGFFSCLKPTLF